MSEITNKSQHAQDIEALEVAREQVTILSRALRWYAAPDNWKEDDWGVMAVVRPPAYGNPTRKAANALRRAGAMRAYDERAW